MARYIDFSDILGDEQEEKREVAKVEEVKTKEADIQKKQTLPMPLIFVLIKKCGGLLFSRNKKNKKSMTSRCFSWAKKTAKYTCSATKKAVKYCIRKAKNVDKAKVAGVLNNYAKKLHIIQNKQPVSNVKASSNARAARGSMDYSKMARSKQPSYYKWGMRPDAENFYSFGYKDIKKEVLLRKSREEKRAEKAQNNAKNAQKGKIFAKKAVSVAKKTVPFVFAVLPGGLITSVVLSRYQAQTEAFNQMNIEIANAEATRAARESFVNAINNIDGQKWIAADDNAYQVAQAAYEEYLAVNLNDLSGAKAIFDNTYTTNICTGLELTPEQYEGYMSLHNPLAIECEKNIDYWLNYGWHSMGYTDEVDALDKNPELFDGLINDEEWAVNAWNEMTEKASTTYLDAGIFDVMKTQSSDFAANNISALGDAVIVTAAEYADMNPFLGGLGAACALGAGALALYGGYKLVGASNKQEVETQEQSVETGELVEFRHL